MYIITSDIYKVLVLFYILVVSFIEPQYLSFANNVLIKICLVVMTVVVLLLVDMTLAFVMGIAIIITFIRSDLPKTLQQIQKPEQSFLPPIEFMEKFKFKQNATLPYEHVVDPPINEISEFTQHEIAQKAIEKYAVETLLHKASMDGIIAENYNKFDKTLGEQFNIQGIEPDISGYNNKD